jgi:DNA ligase (NAD+)
MLSLDNVFSKREFQSFIQQNNIDYYNAEKNSIQFIAEPKFDGVSLSLTYQFGTLIKAATRGNGVQGEVVIDEIGKIRNLPLTLDKSNIEVPDIFEVRIEVFMEDKDFHALNEIRSGTNKALFRNTRNAASGYLREYKENNVLRQPLNYFAYGAENVKIDSQIELVKSLQEWGFSTCKKHILSKNINSLYEFYRNLNDQRKNIPYGIDGVVYKTNISNIQKYFGYSSKSPKFSIAYKFPSTEVESTLKTITYQVGKSGILTPVAHFKPILIHYTSISKATLHNYSEIQNQDLKIGDRILVKKSGDVIPKVLYSIKDEKHKFRKPFNSPIVCPSCSSKLIQYSSKISRCVSYLLCKSQIVKTIEHFCSKEAFDIGGLGSKNVQFLYEQNFLGSIKDVFNLKRNNIFLRKPLEKHNQWGKKSVSNLFSSIEKSRRINLDKFIYAIGIPGIGTVNSRYIANEYENFRNFLLCVSRSSNCAINYQKLVNINGIGDVIASAVTTFINNSNNSSIISQIIDNKLVEIINHKIIKNTHYLQNKKLVLTGSLKYLSRTTAKHYAKDLGIMINESVSMKTDLLIEGNNHGSKSKKANILGVKTLNEAEWIGLRKLANQDNIIQ